MLNRLVQHAFNTLCDNSEISALYSIYIRDDSKIQDLQLGNLMFKWTDTLIWHCPRLPRENQDIIPVSMVTFYMLVSILYRGINLLDTYGRPCSESGTSLGIEVTAGKTPATRYLGVGSRAALKRVIVFPHYLFAKS